MDGVVGRILGARRRSYGASEMLVHPKDGGEPRVELVEHPGEVWIRYSLDDTEPWTRIEMRRTCSKKYKDQYDRDEEGTVMNVGTDELPESKKKIKWDIKRFPLYEDGMRPICAKKKRDLLKHCEGLPEDRRAYYQDMKADGEVVDSGGDTDDEGGHADESDDSESDNDNNSGNDDD